MISMEVKENLTADAEWQARSAEWVARSWYCLRLLLGACVQTKAPFQRSLWSPAQGHLQ